MIIIYIIYTDWSAKLLKSPTKLLTTPIIDYSIISAKRLLNIKPYGLWGKYQPPFPFAIIKVGGMTASLLLGAFPKPVGGTSIFIGIHFAIPDGSDINKNMKHQRHHFQVLVNLEKEQTLEHIWKNDEEKLLAEPIVLEGIVCDDEIHPYFAKLKYPNSVNSGDRNDGHLDIIAGEFDHKLDSEDKVAITYTFTIKKYEPRDAMFNWITRSTTTDMQVAWYIADAYPGAHLLYAEYHRLNQEKAQKLMHEKFSISPDLSQKIHDTLLMLQDENDDLDTKFMKDYLSEIQKEENLNKEENQNDSIKSL